ncbi:MAG: hypothetical protein QG656_2298 [Candidatus Hydrogenedentes bacterium]|nr:hypothetical protein [Candidatus Hydrogenedentota bacterium]
MPNAAANGLRLSTAILLLSGYVALAATLQYGIPILMIPLLLLPMAPIGEELDRQFALYGRLANGFTAVFALTLTGLFLAGALDLIDALTLLIIFIQVFLLLHKKEPRSYHYLFLMSFFELMIASHLAAEPLIAVAMFFFLTSAIWAFALLQIHIELEQDLARSVPEILDLDASDGRRLPGDYSVLLDRGFVVITTMVCVAAMLMTATLFLVTPRFEAGFLGRGSSDDLTTGLSQTVDLAQSGRISQDPTPVMRVEFPQEPGNMYSGELFWRTSTLDYYEDGIWSRHGVAARFRDNVPRLHLRSMGPANQPNQNMVVREIKGTGRMVLQSIYMDDVPDEGMPCLPFAQQLEVAGSPRDLKVNWDESGDLTVLFGRRNSRRAQYEVWSEVESFRADELRQAPGDYRDYIGITDLFLLTKHSIKPETRQLINGIVANAPTVYDKVKAVQSWLEGAGGFSYTLDLPELDPEYPIDDFILNTKRGHCELFASAMALMLRSAGIPTRVVVGFRGGEWNPSDRSYLVRASMAHLWLEVYFINYGWVTFDPSPPSSVLGDMPLGRFGNALSIYVLRAKIWWYRHIIGYDRALQLKTWQQLSLSLVGFGAEFIEKQTVAAGAGKLPRVSWKIFAGVLAVGFMLAAASRTSGKRRYQPAYLLTVDQARMVKLYDRFRGKLARLGIDCHGKTAEEIRDALTAAPVREMESALGFIAAYNAVRFGGRPLPKKQYALLKKAVRTIKPMESGARSQ